MDERFAAGMDFCTVVSVAFLTACAIEVICKSVVAWRHGWPSKEHEEDYCGIVYADDLQQPSFIKIYDPHNLGVSCGYSENPPLPGWIMSQIAPCDLPAAQALTGTRRRWWQRLFGS